MNSEEKLLLGVLIGLCLAGGVGGVLLICIAMQSTIALLLLVPVVLLALVALVNVDKR